MCVSIIRITVTHWRGLGDSYFRSLGRANLLQHSSVNSSVTALEALGNRCATHSNAVSRSPHYAFQGSDDQAEWIVAGYKIFRFDALHDDSNVNPLTLESKASDVVQTVYHVSLNFCMIIVV